MSAPLAEIQSLVERYLSRRNPEVVTFVDEMVRLIPSYKFLLAKPGQDPFIFLSNGAASNSVEVRGARSIVRMICARLSKFASDNGGGPFTPYGGHHDLSIRGSDGDSFRISIDFTNTSRSQEFRLELRDQSRAPEA